MTATYTFDVFSSLDGFGTASGNWGGYWGKQGPELLEHRLAVYSEEQRMVFGANTYRAFAQMLAASTEESEVRDPWVTRMRNLPATVVSTTLEGPLDWPDATVVSGDAVDVVARLKEESDVPLRSHGSLSMNRALMAAGLVDRVQVTLFPVITGQTGPDPIFQGAADFDLELIESRTSTAAPKSSSTGPPCTSAVIPPEAEEHDHSLIVRCDLEDRLARCALVTANAEAVSCCAWPSASTGRTAKRIGRFRSPLVGDVEHHPAVGAGTGEHEHPEGQPRPYADGEGAVALEAAAEHHVTQRRVAQQVRHVLADRVRHGAEVVSSYAGARSETRNSAPPAVYGDSARPSPSVHVSP